MKQEKILCAAIHYQNEKQYKYQPTNILNGFVISGFRHNNCIALISSFVPSWLYKKELMAQGFLTSNNRFVDRKEAYKIFLITNPQFETFDEFNEELFSEDLY